MNLNQNNHIIVNKAVFKCMSIKKNESQSNYSDQPQRTKIIQSINQPKLEPMDIAAKHAHKALGTVCA